MAEYNMEIMVGIIDSWVDHDIIKGYTGYVLCVFLDKMRLLEKKL